MCGWFFELYFIFAGIAFFAAFLMHYVAQKMHFWKALEVGQVSTCASISDASVLLQAYWHITGILPYWYANGSKVLNKLWNFGTCCHSLKTNLLRSMLILCTGSLVKINGNWWCLMDW